MCNRPVPNGNKKPQNTNNIQELYDGTNDENYVWLIFHEVYIIYCVKIELIDKSVITLCSIVPCSINNDYCVIMLWEKTLEGN